MPFRSYSALARLRHLFATSLLAAVAVGQNPASVEQVYDQAAAQPSGIHKTAALEDVAQRASGSPIRIDALELLVWEYARLNPQQAGNAARELFAADAGNPLAIAVLKSGAGIREAKGNARQDTAMLIEALRNLPRLRQPRSVSQPEFVSMQRWTYALLSGSAGMAYSRAKNYDDARRYLRNALTVMPSNGAWNYALGLADLEASSPQTQVGFQELARAVVLTQGTEDGRAINQFALEKYLDAGGTAADWNKYLAYARATAPSTAAASRLPQIALVNFDLPDVRKAERKEIRKPTPRATEAARNNKPAVRNTKAKERAKGEVEEAINREPSDSLPRPIPEVEQRHVTPFPPGEPVSLGILLEASIKKESRDEVVQALSDVVRRLRTKDEAFVLAFGNQLEFEQDLTQNYRLLERAVDEIKPDSGTALYEAVGFAAGHLKRIAKNRNQVLLVVSDGRNSSNRETSFQLASQINNVKIYCIGVGAESAENKYALQSLASYTGGRVAFITSSDQFEPALQSLAQVIYGPYPVQESRK